jgi:hypothetical protein
VAGDYECAPPPLYQIEIKKANNMTSDILRDLPFSRNETLKSADEYFVILKNKII